MRAIAFCAFVALLCGFRLMGQTTDLVFVADTGLRLTDASIPEVGYDEATGTYYLFHNGEGAIKGEAVATSKDGLAFSAVARQTSMAFDPRRVKLPDGKWRLYFWDDPVKPQTLKSSVSADGVNFKEETGARYTLQANDKNSVGIYEIFANADGTLVLLYLGDLKGLNNARRAVSLDTGKTFVFDRTNVLGDSAFGGGGNSYVDITTILLPDGRRRLFSMRQGHTIYSHTSADGGKTWALEAGFRLRDSTHFDRYQAKSLNDPSVIRLPDGRYRIYAASYLNDGRGCCRWAIVSATTAAPTSVLGQSDERRGTQNELDVSYGVASERIRATVRLGQSSYARLTLYDILGREAQSVFEGELPAGDRSFEFAPIARSTSYFLRLQTPFGIIVKHMGMPR